MGFDVSVVTDILKMPSPLFPKYKNSMPVGLRYDIPPLSQDFIFKIELPVNAYELNGFVFSSTGYKDRDAYSLIIDGVYILNHIYTKELGQHIDLHPVRKFTTPNGIVNFVYHNTSGTSKVIWIDLLLTCKDIITVTGGSSSTGSGNPPQTQPVTKQISPLIYFVAGSGEDGYIDDTTINTNYWTPIDFGTVKVEPPFWKGRNELLTKYQVPKSVINNLSKFETYLFYMVTARINGFEQQLFNTPWTNFKTKAKEDYATQGGLTLEGLTDIELARIYLAYHIKACVSIFPSFAQITTLTLMDLITKYFNFQYLFVFDWVDFNDVATDDPGTITLGYAFDPAGFSTDPSVYGPLKTIKAYINMEPQALQVPADQCRHTRPTEFELPATASGWTDSIHHAMSGESDPFEKYWIKEEDNGISVISTFIHENGHAVDFYQRDKCGKLFSQQDDWLSIAGWDPDYYTKYPDYSHCPFLPVPIYKTQLPDDHIEPPISDYGCSHPCEDFAETFAYYIINPNFVKIEYPKRFAFMEKYIKPFKG